MKTFILAGGFGTRFAEMTDLIPKPMIEIGGFPILVHIMSHYSSYGIKDFVILAGYKHEIIENYFNAEGLELMKRNSWSVQVIDTGEGTSTAGRLVRASSELPNEFMLTYGDGIADVDINKLQNTHLKGQTIGTVTAVRPPARFGTIEFEGNKVTSFREKDPQRTGWINGGFFCFSRNILEYINDVNSSLESSPLARLTSDGELGVYPHEGFWHPMDTLRDQRSLQRIWEQGSAGWNREALL